MKYKIFFTKKAAKDISTLTPKLRNKAERILKEVIAEDPFVGKKLTGELKGNFSYRLNLKNRFIYSIDKKKRHIYIKRARTHYGN